MKKPARKRREGSSADIPITLFSFPLCFFLTSYLLLCPPLVSLCLSNIMCSFVFSDSREIRWKGESVHCSSTLNSLQRTPLGTAVMSCDIGNGVRGGDRKLIVRSKAKLILVQKRLKFHWQTAPSIGIKIAWNVDDACKMGWVENGNGSRIAKPSWSRYIIGLWNCEVPRNSCERGELWYWKQCERWRSKAYKGSKAGGVRQNIFLCKIPWRSHWQTAQSIDIINVWNVDDARKMEWFGNWEWFYERQEGRIAKPFWRWHIMAIWNCKMLLWKIWTASKEFFLCDKKRWENWEPFSNWEPSSSQTYHSPMKHWYYRKINCLSFTVIRRRGEENSEL